MSIRSIIYLLKMKMASPRQRAEMLKNGVGGIIVGNNCEIQSNVTFGSEPYLIEVGDNVRITQGVTFVTHDGGMWVLMT